MSEFEPTGDPGGNSASGGTNTVVETPSTAVAEPTVIDIPDENALIRVKGSEKPVKYGDHVKGFQSQFTKASQRAALLEKQLQQERTQRERLEQAQRQAQSQPTASTEDIFASLRQLPYLTGEDAVGVVQSIGQQLRQRDMVLMGALKQMQAMQERLQRIDESYTNQSFDQKINSFLSNGGYGPEYAEYAKELYLAYEPSPTLDDEFPQILAARLEGLEKLLDAKRQAKINGARKSPFVPGKGGNAHPSKPLQFKADASAKEITDQLWESLQSSGT
jgi:hypothetical protein